MSPTLANLLREIVVLTFTNYRDGYDAEDFDWMTMLIRDGCSEAQAYLALHALPERWAREAGGEILRSLARTAFIEEARCSLSEEET